MTPKQKIMRSVVTTMTINAPVDKVWSVIAKGSGLDKWFPVIATCELKGTGEGAKRECTTVQGALLKETIITIDSNARVFQYTIDEQNMMPTKNVLGSIYVSDAENNGSKIVWMANFELTDPAMEQPVLSGIDELYQSGIKGLEQFISNN
mgnify:CR=1 FL=1